MASTDNNPVPTEQQNSTAQEHSQSCTDPSHHHDLPPFFDPNDLFSSLTAPKTENATKRKGKKKATQGTIRAETIPGNRGNENIDDLVNFINSPATNEKKQKKKSSTGTN